MGTYEPTDGYLTTVVTDHLCNCVVMGSHFLSTRGNNDLFPSWILSSCLWFVINFQRTGKSAINPPSYHFSTSIVIYVRWHDDDENAATITGIHAHIQHLKKMHEESQEIFLASKSNYE